jgi:hypothetical protein
MSNELMKLIDDYAAWSAQSAWQDTHGYTWDVGTARVNKEAARKAVVDAVDFRNEPLSRAMTQWIKEGRAILAKRKENNNEDA